MLTRSIRSIRCLAALVAIGSSLAAQQPLFEQSTPLPAPTCVDALRDPSTGQCTPASSIPLLGALLPYPGEDSTVLTGAVASGGRENLAGSYAVIGGGRLNRATRELGAIPGGHGNVIREGRWGVIGGGDANELDEAADQSRIGGGWENSVYAPQATVAGGRGNTASWVATVSGGYQNTAYTGAASQYQGSTVGGGAQNSALGRGAGVVLGGTSNLADGLTSFYGCAAVGGGLDNEALGGSATLLGGANNRSAGGTPTVGGGLSNDCNFVYGTIGGGFSNRIPGDGGAETIVGGWQHEAQGGGAIAGGTANEAFGSASVAFGGRANRAHGWHAATCGGYNNQALADWSCAVGRAALTVHQGAFVFGDSHPDSKLSGDLNQFTAHAAGGARVHAGAGGVSLAPGAGSWSTISDRAAKEDLEAVDPAEVLNVLADVPVTTWNYRAQGRGVSHMGPMAQDLYARFGLGSGATSLDVVDADGLVLAAIQGLRLELLRRSREVAGLRARVAATRSARPAGTDALPH